MVAVDHVGRGKEDVAGRIHVHNYINQRSAENNGWE